MTSNIWDRTRQMFISKCKYTHVYFDMDNKVDIKIKEDKIVYKKKRVKHKTSVLIWQNIFIVMISMWRTDDKLEIFHFFLL